ncbi:MAG: protein kinase, partial [Gemmatimonadaceae bacterium]
LGYAHSLGVIHRDIKPENILLQGGHALVADFGIALAVQSAGGQRMTQTGLSLGTPQYMSPEQAMGERTIDARSDIYALGAVTYEMLTGDPPFTGSTVQAIVAKVLTEKPTAPRAVRDTVSPGVEFAVLKALAKLPADRWPTTEKFAEALIRTDVNLSSTSHSATRATAPARTTLSRGFLIGAAIGVIALTATAAWLGARVRTPVASWSAFTQLTDASGVETSPSLSPDGQSFAYASNMRGTMDIYMQRVGGRNPTLIAGDSLKDELWPTYSPDGKQIAYAVRGDGIFVVGATGESARRVTTGGTHPSWSPDGQHLVFSSIEIASPFYTTGNGIITVVDVSGANRHDINVGGDGGYQPVWSPSGNLIAYWTAVEGVRDLFAISAKGGTPVQITHDKPADWAPAWAPDGKSLYFASDRGGTMGIWRIAVDQTSGKATGVPEAVVAGTDIDMDLAAPSSDGQTLIFRSVMKSVNPAVMSFDQSTARVGAPQLLQQRTGLLSPSSISSDGQWLALANVLGAHQDIWAMRTDGQGLTRLTDDDARDLAPRFAPDGKTITFYSNQTGRYEAFGIQLDGGARTKLSALSQGVFAPLVTPDGKRLIIATFPDGRISIGDFPGPVKDATITALKGIEIDGGILQLTTLSPDGRWLVGGIGMPSGENVGLAIYNIAAAQMRKLTNESVSGEAAWMPDMRHVVYFTTRGALVMQDIESMERRVVADSLRYPPDLTQSIVASPDGRRLYYGAQQMESNIWMVKKTLPLQ